MKSASLIFSEVYLKSVKNSILNWRLLDEIRVGFFAYLFCLVSLGLFIFFTKLFYWADSVFLVGPLIVSRFFSLMTLSVWWLAFFSSISSVYNHFYFHKDIPFILSLPMSMTVDFFAVKFFSVLKDAVFSSGIILLPVVVALGVVRSATSEFYLHSLVALLPFFVSASGCAVILVLSVSAFFPAARSRRIAWLIMGFGFMVFYIVARFMIEPLRALALPYSSAQTAAAEKLASFLSIMSKPAARNFPSGMYSDIVFQSLKGDTGWHSLWVPWAGIIFYAVISVVLCVFIMKKFYLRSFASRNDGGVYAGVTRSGLNFFNKDSRKSVIYALISIDIKNILRDPSRWSQGMVVIGLIVVYVVSMWRALLDASIFYLKSVVIILGAGLGAIICSALSLRFVFSEIADRRTYDEIKAIGYLPLDVATMAREKFFTRALPSAFCGWLAGVVALLPSVFANVSYGPMSLAMIYPMRILFFLMSVFLVGVCASLTSAAFLRGVVVLKKRIASGEMLSSPESSPEGILFSLLSVFYIVINLAVIAMPFRRYYFYVLSSQVKANNGGVHQSLFTFFLVVLVVVTVNLFLAFYFYKKSIRAFSLLR